MSAIKCYAIPFLSDWKGRKVNTRLTQSLHPFFWFFTKSGKWARSNFQKRVDSSGWNALLGGEYPIHLNGYCYRPQRGRKNAQWDEEGRKQPFIQNKHTHDKGKDVLNLSFCPEPCIYCTVPLDELLGHMLNVYANEGRFVECPSADDACDVRDRCAPHICIYPKTSIFFPCHWSS